MQIICNAYIKREGEMYSAVCIEFDVASCGHTPEEAYKNVIEAVTIHLRDAQELGTLEEVLAEVGFEAPAEIADDVTTQAAPVMLGAPFIAEVV